MSEYPVETYPQRQAKLEAAKAAFFNSGREIMVLASAAYMPLPSRHEPVPSPQKFRDAACKRPYSDPGHDAKMCEQIKALQALGLNRHQVARQLQISGDRLMRLIQAYKIDFPKAKTGKKCVAKAEP